MPAPRVAGVFGIARMTGNASLVAASMAEVVTEAAMEISTAPGLSEGVMACTRSATWVGLTPSRTMSASATARGLSVSVRMPRRRSRALARSACATVAVM